MEQDRKYGRHVEDGEVMETIERKMMRIELLFSSVLCKEYGRFHSKV